MYDDEAAHPDEYYDEEPPRRRSRLVPILTIIAGLLAIVVGIAVVLFFLGVFDSGPRVASTSEPARIEAAQPTQRVATPPPQPAQPAPTESSVPRASVSLAPANQDLPPIRSTHGDWQLRCDTPAGAASEQCFLMQFVTAEDRDNVGLMVVVLKTADGQARIMRIVAPLGVLLPSGLGLRIDQRDLGRAGFVRCTPRGCVAEVILEDTLLEQLQAGATATFIIFQTPEEGVGIPIALTGFGDGFANLP